MQIGRIELHPVFGVGDGPCHRARELRVILPGDADQGHLLGVVLPGAVCLHLGVGLLRRLLERLQILPAQVLGDWCGAVPESEVLGFRQGFLLVSNAAPVRRDVNCCPLLP